MDREEALPRWQSPVTAPTTTQALGCSMERGHGLWCSRVGFQSFCSCSFAELPWPVILLLCASVSLPSLIIGLLRDSNSQRITGSQCVSSLHSFQGPWGWGWVPALRSRPYTLGSPGGSEEGLLGDFSSQKAPPFLPFPSLPSAAPTPSGRSC